MLATSNKGLCVITSRYSIGGLANLPSGHVVEIRLGGLDRSAALVMLRSLGVKGPDPELKALVQALNGHALALSMVGGHITLTQETCSKHAACRSLSSIGITNHSRQVCSRSSQRVLLRRWDSH